MMLMTGVVKLSNAQTITPEEYVAKYKDLAIREMKRMGVPAAITLAQGLLETESGNSELVKNSNNHFGIKCKPTWTAGGYNHDDDAKGECFRTYNTAEDSYRDHSNFLRGSDRYAFLFRLNPLDYKSWAYGLKKAGYATNPKYPLILINNIEQYNLQQYSEIAAKDIPGFDPSKYQDDPELAVNALDTTESDLQSSGSINGCKYIMADKGTSLLAIATQNNIDLPKLLDYNDMTEDGILDRSQIIFLQKKSKVGDKDFYVVEQENSLYNLSQEHGIQLTSLMEYNKLKSDNMVAAGTKLYLKPIQPIAKADQLTGQNAKVTYHTVQPKEGLYSISKQYGVTVDQIKAWNNLSSNDLHIGQQLIVQQK